MRFDVSRYIGEQVSVKLDLGTARPLDFQESWTLASVTLEATTVDDDALISQELSIGTNFPEPFSDVTNLVYTIPEESLVKISVYDLTGRRVIVPVFSEHGPGSYTLEISASKLAAGMYFVVVESGGSVVTETDFGNSLRKRKTFFWLVV